MIRPQSYNLYVESYPEFERLGYTNVDGTIAFYRRVNAAITADSVVLDVGCGRGSHAEDPVPERRSLRDFRGRAARVIGIDVDPRAAGNPFLDQFGLIHGDEWPVDNESVDVCIADFVFEHVADPDRFLHECFRVLRPGGLLCIRTSNVFSYFGLAARIIPSRIRPAVLRTAQPDRDGEDIFPTFYRCNTVPRLRRALARHRFDHEVFGFEAEPRYLQFSKTLFRLGVVHQRFAPGVLRTCIFAFARRP